METYREIKKEIFIEQCSRRGVLKERDSEKRCAKDGAVSGKNFEIIVISDTNNSVKNPG